MFINLRISFELTYIDTNYGRTCNLIIDDKLFEDQRTFINKLIKSKRSFYINGN